MGEIALKVENLYKHYRLGVIGNKTIKDDLKIRWGKLRGKQVDDLFKVDANNRHTGSSEYIWALKDINFEVKKGEILGVIGKNGAGKSTLLKLLSKVTGPTKGSIKINGRIASLLEVGTGFHPELTGRENIFLNGAILGMSKSEINEKIDDIIEFSGIGKYINTPAKRYSSGMKVRLGFAVAAHLEPDILIVDEVLAVGDADFQKKCIGKMNDVSKNQGRTVLFVSHNMASVMELCDRGLLMTDGEVDFIGPIGDTITKYLNNYKSEIKTQDLYKVKTRQGNGDITFEHYQILNNEGQEVKLAFSGQDITFRFKMKINRPTDTNKLHFSIKFVNENDHPLFHLSNTVANGKEFRINEKDSELIVDCHISKLPLQPGNYPFHLFCSNIKHQYDEINFANELKVEGGNFYDSGKLPSIKLGSFLVDNHWELIKR